MDDKTALEEMRKGGKAGFETLYNRYFFKLRSKILNNSSKKIIDIADEICQDVFYSFYKNISTFEEKCNVMTWLLKLARNRIVDYLRKEEKKHPTMLQNVNYSSHLSSFMGHDPIFEIEFEEICQEVYEFCEKLREEANQSIHRKDAKNRLFQILAEREKTILEGIILSHGKLAKRLKMSIGAVNDKIGKLRQFSKKVEKSNNWNSTTLLIIKKMLK
jgi:RNA polymerase sigma factor (sigma-70 family)